ncbi:thiamine pyrophosphate-dependent enzyme [Pigmentiphaga soli]|uniref:Thiamine pyrophosphate-dependent enzyme n=1 Tax=Pigmentiphaga soli TaxID=1007095 RepID=A0ABP8GKV7_9BURK
MEKILHRREVASVLLAGRGDALVVAGLGSPIWDVTSVEDSHANFPVWGAMGGAACIGLGLALAQPDRSVLVVTGDGEMLMGLGSLATIAVTRPPNLSVVVMDNGRYGETGMQRAHTGLGVDLAGMAREAGFAQAMTVRTEAELRGLADRVYAQRGPLFAAIKIDEEKLPPFVSPRDGAHLKNRFRIALLGVERAME